MEAKVLAEWEGIVIGSPKSDESVTPTRDKNVNQLLIPYLGDIHANVKFLRVVDLYTLKGEEKRQAIKEMWTVVEKDPCKDRVYRALGFLQRDVNRQKERMEKTERTIQRQREKMQMEALDHFKIAVKLDFMEKYKDNIASLTITPEMDKWLKKFDTMEKYGCYVFNGLSVGFANCELCRYKACKKKDNTYFGADEVEESVEEPMESEE